MITIDRLKELFTYKDGFLIRATRPSNIVNIGDKVGCYDKYGYTVTVIDKKQYKVHRLVWMYHYGIMPDKHIDHINHIRDDNRIENLRVVSIAENSHNMSKPKGVYFSRQNKKWIAEAKHFGKYHYFGQYSNYNDAITARKKGISTLGFHPNHGADNG